MVLGAGDMQIRRPISDGNGDGAWGGAVVVRRQAPGAGCRDD